MQNPFTVGTKRFYVAEQALAGKSKREAFEALRRLVEQGTLVYTRNPTRSEKAIGITHRQPNPLDVQLGQLRDEIGRVWAILGLSKGRRFEDEETPLEEPTPDEVPEDDSPEFETPEIEESPEEDEIEVPETEDETPDLPIAKGKRKLLDEMKYFLKRVREIRAFCLERERLAESIDWISLRPVQAASRLIPAGIPADALLHAMTLHWSADTRNDAGVSTFDVESLSRQIMEDRKISEIIRKDRDGNEYAEPAVSLFGYILTLVENRQPVFLVNDFGIGKTHVAGQIADYLELPYGETSMSSGSTRGDLLGKYTASELKPFITAIANEIYAGGGVMLFDEFDAAEAGMIIVLNSALAGNRFYNSNTGEMVQKHENYIAMAAGNTMGYGATRRYPARNRQDEATLDRWRMGRVIVPLDENVEEFILFSELNKLGISE